MAIIQSILVGKGKGKIGNVVLSGLKGQTVAKQLNSSPSNPRTVAQTENRVKMANAVLAWQFLSLFFASAKGLRKPLESVYNAFVRTVKNGLSDVLYSSRALAGAAALNFGTFAGNWFTVAIGSVVDNTIEVYFSGSGVVWSSTMRVCGIVFESDSGEQVVVDRPITEIEFNNGNLDIIAGEGTMDENAAAYIYDSASSKITNIAYKLS